MLFDVKAILQEEQSWYYLIYRWEDKGVHTFPKGICPKVNVIARLEYELAYYDSTVHRFNHYTTRSPPHLIVFSNTWSALYISISFSYVYYLSFIPFISVTGLVSAQMPFYAGPNYGIGGIGGIGFGYPGGLGAYAHGFEPVTGGIFPYYGAAHSLPWSAPVGGTTHTISHVAHGTLPHPVGPHVSTTSKTVSVHHPTTHVTVHHPAVTTHVQHPDIGFPAALTYPYPGLSPFFPQYPTGVLEHHSPVITETTVEKSKYHHHQVTPSARISLTLSRHPFLFRPSLPVDLQGYILDRHRAVVCRFYLVVILLLVHVKGSTGVHHLWACLYFSSSVLHVCFV